MDEGKDDKFFITYRHFKRKSGGVTAACAVFFDNKAHRKTMFVGLSFCSPEENGFCRREGREHAYKRLLENPIIFYDQEKIAAPIMDYLRGTSVETIFVDMNLKEYNSHNQMRNFEEWFVKFQQDL